MIGLECFYSFIRSLWPPPAERSILRFDANAEKPFICHLPREVQAEIFVYIGPENVPALFQLALACRSTWIMVRNRPEKKLNLLLTARPKGKIWASNPSGCLPDHGHHYGWNVRGIDAINLLFAGRIVPTLYIEDPEFRCNSTRLPGLQALTLEVLGVNTLRMHWPKALKPEGRPFEAVQFRRFEAAAHCCLGSDVAQSIHILHPQSLNDCLILKNRNQRIQICEHLQEQRESYVQKVIAQWMVGKRDIQKIVIASPRRPPSALSAEYERDDGQKILYRTTSNGYLIELDPKESDAVSLM
ncbi:unnamed protein product, partial [Mesorhabditis spiculigera]